ncbi:DegT/DnrJ/EryC1/StrS family aminotransferase [Salidesulfovibrio brasiliensis]|uniref:DegT/DnrJ/EryC1/StrS family aminotransferase n=1 Tax=Salidesulfovibrio brasiliensis TaxID=221711 RepID=UPI0006D1EB74|nr:DegT/DnrJ/EryC1/StrS family aminotransferase [Salidesulfovibrio brasiliensis]
MRIPLIRPYLPPRTKELVCGVLDSGFYVEGPMTARFEQLVADYLGVAHVIAVDSCTDALEISLRCLGIGPGNEVITSDYTFPATLQSIILTGATAVVVDVDARSMNIDLEAVEAAITPATKAVMPVATFGNPLEYRRLERLKQKYGLYVVEDAACAFGAEYRGEKVGIQSDLTSFSLHPRKFITTARGGMITTEKAKWAEWIRSYKCFGKGMQATRADTAFEQMGANAMLPDVLSAMGVAQMEFVDEMLARRMKLARRYLNLLQDVDGVCLPETVEGGNHSMQSFCVFVDDRDRVMSAMRNNGIEAQIGTYAMHMHKAFLDNEHVRFESSMSNSRWAFDHCLSLPLYHEMTDAEQDDVVDCLESAVASKNT